jgi:hypothetical protein
MADISEQTLIAICEMRDLIRLMAEPQIAARDKKMRDELIRIVGNSAPKAKSVLLMDGKHTQMEIHKKTGMNLGNLSTLTKQLAKSQLLVGDGKQPKLAISIQSDFFEKAGEK